MATSKLPVLPSTIRYGDMFPFPEGQQIEFKRSLFDKKILVNTACAFLNTCGGYYIIGIWDDNNVVGVVRSKVDETLLRVDQIIQERRIINTTTGDFISHKEMIPRAVAIEGTTSMLIIIQIESYDSSHSYVVHKDESHYVRLGASNMKYHGSLKGTAAKYLIEIDNLKSRLHSARVIKDITLKTNRHLEKIIADHGDVLLLLHKSILEHKKDVEKRLAHNRQHGGLLSLLCF